MTFADLAKRLQKMASDNSPAILTGVGVIGIVGTAYLTGKASFKAAEVIKNEEKKHINVRGETLELLLKEKVNLVWRLYIPAACTGLLTVGCIIGANRIGTNRAAGLAAAYSLSERAYKEYRAKVIEKIGENKERDLRDELAQEKVNANPPSGGDVILVGEGRVLCYDAWTGRYFHSTMETIKKAQNDINYKALHDQYPSLTDFYDMIGLRSVTASDEVGWNSSNQLEVTFSATLVDQGNGQGTVPCMVISFAVEPLRNHYKASSY